MIKPANIIIRCKSEEKGSTALEAALIFPVLFSLIFTIVDTGRLLIADGLMLTALGSFSRDFRYPNADKNHALTNEYALLFIKNILNDRAPGWIEEEKLTLSITSITDPSLGRCAEEDGECSLVEIVYPFSPTTPLSGLLFSEEILQRKSAVYVMTKKTEVDS